MEQKPIVFFDLETTGTDVVKDRIIEIYLCKMNIDGNIVDELYTYINPERFIPKEATDVHHITNEMVKDAPTFATKGQEILKFVEGCYICGHNSNKFDVVMLSEEFTRVGLRWSFSFSDLLDTYMVERAIESHSLVETYKRYYGKDYSETIGDAHGAKADTLAVVDVFKAQLARLNLQEALSAENLEKFRQTGKPNENQVDLAGYLTKAPDGTILYNFGKNKGQAVKADIGYANWMLGQSFPLNTKQWLRYILTPQA